MEQVAVLAQRLLLLVALVAVVEVFLLAQLRAEQDLKTLMAVLASTALLHPFVLAVVVAVLETMVLQLVQTKAVLAALGHLPIPLGEQQLEPVN